MHLYLIILFPLLGFLINGFAHLIAIRSGKKVSANFSGGLATGAMLISFLVVVIAFFKIRYSEARMIEETVFNWLHLGGLNVDFALRLDPLSVVFALVITGVGTLIHLYSISYMHDDETPAKYFAYLNLFCFMMLNLVLGATLPHVFLGWEGVGLASYLLIGYWYEDGANVMAGQKAFVMNRIGDLGFLIAMFVAFKFAGTLDLMELQKASLTPHVLTVFGLLIFFACTGKSAQIPLFTWLPDAMAGPTPVSALIHAATMVTSGIYLLARLYPVIMGSDVVLLTIATVGAVTAFMAAIMACSQTDIKKILAYSTISQLGFMFLGCGVGAFDAGVFHVMTHAFFKALLFLAAGSVIHALGGEQEIFKMGNLRKRIPITFITFTAGWAAILGLPPFSGFFSKDEIIYQALVSPHGSKMLFGLGIVSAFLTAFYMTRLYVLVFFSESRMSKEVESHLHESPKVMTIPLIALSVLALAGGWFGAPVHFGEAEVNGDSTQYIVMAASVLLALLGAALAFQKYSRPTKIEVTRDPFKIDQIYGFVFGKGTRKLSEGVSAFLEEMIVQRVMKLTSAVIDLSGNILRVTQVGSAQAYLMMILLGALTVVAWFYFGVGHYGKL
jgi:NADH-quinone oxidoreductase subunit L